MKKPANLFFRRSLKQMFSQTLSYTAIATTGLIASILIFSSEANAQNSSPVNSNEITSYAQAVLAMEPARQQAFDEIKKLMGGREIPKIVCNDPKSIGALPKKAQGIAVNYCKHSQKIVEDNNLTIERFNLITVETQKDENLKRQISNELIRLQNASKAR
ncbi:DUF4168 domain-containing protein [Tolypothrix sp. FACHB-123]|uniref:DUF4168 domain-containing protein n=1 Tax=Tolypothrix sp. FACHB-123 TaxID=2692868 RepID=UPI0016851535|nr:DUF4168 domain-containing protein [Tolypothrix sp. FACHB-123]MBD2356301.1 DUF4168 domain-containing protein [Tolypothrix sp. FACHB-123]